MFLFVQVLTRDAADSPLEEMGISHPQESLLVEALVPEMGIRNGHQ
jgi:hypothetical protein